MATVESSLWRAMPLIEREREYMPSSCIGGNYQPLVAAYKSRSIDARGNCAALGATWHTLRYGAKPAHRIDLCMPGVSAPRTDAKPGLLVFIHGGYWQELSAKDSLFAATGCIENGHAFAAIDYTLAPLATVAQIVEECREALRRLAGQAGTFGFDPARVVVAGSSAGAHLAALLAWPRWRDLIGAACNVRAAVLVSGVYELEPLVGTGINAALGLDAAAARAASPALLDLAGFPQTMVAWGAVETQEFKRQSRSFARDLTAVGILVETLEVPQRNHFDVILDLADASTSLGAHTLAYLKSD
jgi:arylformamidase